MFVCVCACVWVKFVIAVYVFACFSKQDLSYKISPYPCFSEYWRLGIYLVGLSPTASEGNSLLVTLVITHRVPYLCLNSH